MSEIKELYFTTYSSMLSRYAVTALNLLSMMILARPVTPEIFCTVAAFMVFFTFFQLMATVRLGPTMINPDSLAPVDCDGLFKSSVDRVDR